MSTAFQAVLQGSQEVPPTGSTATGLGTVIFDSAATAAPYEFQIQGVDFGPVTGRPPQTPSTLDDVNAMHFHNGVRGVSGPIVFGQINPAQDNDDLVIVPNMDGSWSVSGNWETTDPANVSIADFATTLGSAAVGSEVPLYFNVHTNQFPMGEIRGQLVTIADDNDNVVDGTAGNDLLPGLGGNDTISGLAGNDTLTGGDGNDNIDTGAGNDLVSGDAGNDTIGGMTGSDTVFAGAGDDSVTWNDPTGDIVLGQDGNDMLRGGDVAADTISGGTGDDVIQAVANRALAGNAPDVLFGDDGNDIVIGGNANDTIVGGAGNDILAGAQGADQFVFSTSAPGNDLIVDFDTTQDLVVLSGFGSGFDPLARLSATPSGSTTMNLGDAGQETFLGHSPNEFTALDFLFLP
jgi:serralysin